MTTPAPFRFVDDDDNDDDETDDEMPPLEETTTASTSGSPAPTALDAAAPDPKPMVLQRLLTPETSAAAAAGIDALRMEGVEQEEEEDDDNDRGNANRFAALQSSDSDNNSDDDDDDDDDSAFVLEDLEEDYGDISIDEEDTDEEDGDDDDNNSHGSHPGMPAGLLDFFRALTNVVEQDDDPNEEEDDDSDCNCPRCWMARFGLSEDDDDNYLPEEEEEVALDPMASPCAICLEPETKTRKFVTLPCCGGTSVEATSSTRFCQKCVVQYMARTGNGVPHDRSMHVGTTGPLASKSSLVGECPRCKKLLILTEKKTRSKKKKKLPYYQRTHLVLANAHQYHWYIGRVDGGNYRVYLLTLAWSDSKYIPEELLLNDAASTERIAHLCQWGILQKVKLPHNNNNKNNNNNRNNKNSSVLTWPARRLANIGLSQKLHAMLHRVLPSVIADPENTHLPNHSGAIYTVSHEMQTELRNLLVKHLEMDEDWGLRLSRTELDEPGNGGKQSFMVACNCAASAFMAVSKLRVGRAIRLLNRGMTLTLSSFRCILPNVTQWPSDLATYTKCWHAATLLNVVLLYFLLQVLGKAFWIVWYLFKGFCACRLVALCFVPPEQRWKRMARNAGLFVVFAHFVAVPLFLWYRSWTAAADTDDINDADSGDEMESLESILERTAPLVGGGDEF